MSKQVAVTTQTCQPIYRTTAVAGGSRSAVAAAAAAMYVGLIARSGVMTDTVRRALARRRQSIASRHRADVCNSSPSRTQPMSDNRCSLRRLSVSGTVARARYFAHFPLPSDRHDLYTVYVRRSSVPRTNDRLIVRTYSPRLLYWRCLLCCRICLRPYQSSSV
jgi:hypothetical protein